LRRYLKGEGLFACGLALLLAGCQPGPAASDTVPGPSGPEVGPDRAQPWWVPVQPTADPARTYLLQTTLYRPPGAGPFPLVTINHGVPGDKRFLRTAEPAFEAVAHWWVGQGYAVAVPLRRGVGRSQGTFAEGTETCDAAGFSRVAYVAAADMKGVVEYLAAEPFVDPRHIIVLGNSVGGLGALAVAADPPAGVTGVVDFSGGAGGFGNDQLCGDPAALVETARQLGLRAKRPALWLYAANDHWFGTVARPMFEAYRAADKAPTSFVQLPPFGDEGHATLYRADPTVWASAVTAFLATLPR
jgi:dienelactone hydrolase